MESMAGVRIAWLRGMYLYTTVGAGVLGLLLLIAPSWLATQLGMPAQDRVVLGVVGSSYVAFGGLALFGLRWPLRFAPLLLLQMTYKLLWLVGVLVPLVLRDAAPPYAWLFGAVFVSYVVGDLIAIPFRRLFGDGATP